MRTLLILSSLVIQALSAPSGCIERCDYDGIGNQQALNTIQSELNSAHFNRPGNWTEHNQFITDGGRGHVHEERGQVESDNKKVRHYSKNYTSSFSSDGVELGNQDVLGSLNANFQEWKNRINSQLNINQGQKLEDLGNHDVFNHHARPVTSFGSSSNWHNVENSGIHGYSAVETIPVVQSPAVIRHEHTENYTSQVTSRVQPGHIVNIVKPVKYQYPGTFGGNYNQGGQVTTSTTSNENHSTIVKTSQTAHGNNYEGNQIVVQGSGMDNNRGQGLTCTHTSCANVPGQAIYAANNVQNHDTNFGQSTNFGAYALPPHIHAPSRTHASSIDGNEQTRTKETHQHSYTSRETLSPGRSSNYGQIGNCNDGSSQFPSSGKSVNCGDQVYQGYYVRGGEQRSENYHLSPPLGQGGQNTRVGTQQRNFFNPIFRSPSGTYVNGVINLGTTHDSQSSVKANCDQTETIDFGRQKREVENSLQHSEDLAHKTKDWDRTSILEQTENRAAQEKGVAEQLKKNDQLQRNNKKLRDDIGQVNDYYYQENNSNVEKMEEAERYLQPSFIRATYFEPEQQTEDSKESYNLMTDHSNHFNKINHVSQEKIFQQDNQNHEITSQFDNKEVLVAQSNEFAQFLEELRRAISEVESGVGNYSETEEQLNQLLDLGMFLGSVNLENKKLREAEQEQEIIDVPSKYQSGTWKSDHDILNPVKAENLSDTLEYQQFMDELTKAIADLQSFREAPSQIQDDFTLLQKLENESTISPENLETLDQQEWLSANEKTLQNRATTNSPGIVPLNVDSLKLEADQTIATKPKSDSQILEELLMQNMNKKNASPYNFFHQQRGNHDIAATNSQETEHVQSNFNEHGNPGTPINYNKNFQRPTTDAMPVATLEKYTHSMRPSNNEDEQQHQVSEHQHRLSFNDSDDKFKKIIPLVPEILPAINTHQHKDMSTEGLEKLRGDQPPSSIPEFSTTERNIFRKSKELKITDTQNHQQQLIFTHGDESQESLEQQTIVGLDSSFQYTTTKKPMDQRQTGLQWHRRYRPEDLTNSEVSRTEVTTTLGPFIEINRKKISNYPLEHSTQQKINEQELSVNPLQVFPFDEQKMHTENRKEETGTESPEKTSLKPRIIESYGSKGLYGYSSQSENIFESVRADPNASMPTIIATDPQNKIMERPGAVTEIPQMIENVTKKSAETSFWGRWRIRLSKTRDKVSSSFNKAKESVSNTYDKAKESAKDIFG